MSSPGAERASVLLQIFHDDESFAGLSLVPRGECRSGSGHTGAMGDMAIKTRFEHTRPAAQWQAGPVRFQANMFRHSRTATCDIKHKLRANPGRSEEHTSELQSLMRISYAVLCLKKKTHTPRTAISLHSPHNNTYQTLMHY